MKIKQLTSYPIPNEIGLGNTNESYIRIENSIDVSDMFPPNIEVEVVDCNLNRSYKLKSKEGIEFRINQLGQLYRDYNFCSGDEIKFTQIDVENKKTIFFTVSNYNRAYLNVSQKGAEIVNIERLIDFFDKGLQEYSILVDEGTLKLSFDKSEKKRSDSPSPTDFYRATVNDVDLRKGTYYITIKGPNVTIEKVEKNKVEEFFIPSDNGNDMGVFSKNSFPLQQIFYGAPGTGKSNTIKRDVEAKNNIHFRTTFHPDSDYSTFVGCYKPTMKSIKKTVVIGQDEKEVKPLAGGSNSVEQIAYDFVPQAFTKAYCEAWNHYNSNGESEPVFLVIEEINRGNCAQIFGDIFQLLDRETEGARCGYSTYPIDADEDLKKFLLNGTREDGSPWLNNKKGIENGQICFPPNFHIWATMNTSDQSLFPIDSAFKRRWDWKYIPIEDHKDKNWKIAVGDQKYDWWEFLEAMNKRIYKATDSEDKKMGYFFVKLKGGETIISEDVMVNKVLFYLFNDVFKDFDSGDLFMSGNEKLHFSDYAQKDIRTKLLKDLMEIPLALKPENEKKDDNVVNDTPTQATLDL